MKVGDKVMHGGREWKIADMNDHNAYIMDGRYGGKAKWVPVGSLGLTPEDIRLRMKEAKAAAAQELRDKYSEMVKGKSVADLVKMAKQLGVKSQFIDKATDGQKSVGMQTMQLGNLIRNKMIESHAKDALKAV